MEQLPPVTALARLIAKKEKRTEARTKVSEIYNWFTWGFEANAGAPLWSAA